MKRIIYIIILYNCCLIAQNQSPIDRLVTDFQSELIIYSSISISLSDKIALSYAELQKVFVDPGGNLYHNDLNPQDVESNTFNYLQYLEKNHKGDLIVEFDVDYQQELNCTSGLNSYVKVRKINKKKSTGKPINQVEYLIITKSTSSGPKILNVVFLASHDFKNNCATISSNQEEVKALQKTILSLIEQGDLSYSKGEYIKAKKKYSQAYQLDLTNEELPEFIKACDDFITSTLLSRRVENLIKQEDFANAIKYIKQLKEKYPLNTNVENIEKQLKICNNGIKKQKNDQLFKVAESYYHIKDYTNALVYYNQLLISSYNLQIIKERIKQCKNGDPNFIRKKIKIAYNEALKSRKNYLSTFKTYSKYKSTGLLTGEQYHFMCLMMLEKKSSFIKELGYTKKQTKLLARNYFYKAKDLGYNNSLVENQIFTLNIKNRKN